VHFIVLKHSKFSDNKNKANNILIKALYKLYNKFEKYNFNIVASIFVKIIELSFKILKQVIYCLIRINKFIKYTILNTFVDVVCALNASKINFNFINSKSL